MESLVDFDFGMAEGGAQSGAEGARSGGGDGAKSGGRIAGGKGLKEGFGSGAQSAQGLGDFKLLLLVGFTAVVDTQGGGQQADVGLEWVPGRIHEEKIA